MQHIGVQRARATASRPAGPSSPTPATPGRATRSSSWRAAPTCLWPRPPSRTRRTCCRSTCRRAQAGEHATRGRRRAAGAHAHRARRSTATISLAEAALGLRRSRGDRRAGHDDGDRVVSRAAGRARRRRAAPGHVELGFQEWAAGSVLLSMGRRGCSCSASVSDDAPRWLRGTNRGWVTGEYSMLPASTNERIPARGQQGPPRRPHAGDPAADRPLAARRHRPVEARASARSPSTATCCRPTRARARPRSRAATSRWRSRCRGLQERGAVGDDVLRDTRGGGVRRHRGRRGRCWTCATRRTPAPRSTATS